MDRALNDVGIADRLPESSASFSPSRPLKASRNGVYGLSVTAKWIGSLKSYRGGSLPVVVPYDPVLRAKANSVSHGSYWVMTSGPFIAGWTVRAALRNAKKLEERIR